jgi:hypothetical protein
VTGGHYDVDVVLTDPLKNVLYKEERQHIVIGKGNIILFFVCKIDRHYTERKVEKRTSVVDPE